MDKKLSPKDATFDDIAYMQSDTFNTKDFWIVNNGDYVTIYKQRHGFPAESDIKIPKTDFNQLVEWYNEQQWLRRNKITK